MVSGLDSDLFPRSELVDDNYHGLSLLEDSKDDCFGSFPGDASLHPIEWAVGRRLLPSARA